MHPKKKSFKQPTVEYFEKIVEDWESLIESRSIYDSGWIFRGQPIDLPLKTSLERSCDRFSIEKVDIPSVEHQLIRGFRRRYEGSDRQLVLSDTLYCLDLMQHYGAPTRLLDWTYSFLVAAFFAVDKAENESIIWCLNVNWLADEVAKIAPPLMKERYKDSTRNDTSFVNTYFKSKHQFVMAENPFLFHQRQIVQKGVFLCPAKVTSSFDDNLKAIPGCSDCNNIIKLRLKLSRQIRQVALYDLSSMNITSATLFPGLDGLARSLENDLYRYEELARSQTGE